MNRFFRSAFFPLLVIVLLVWLASQTLIPKHGSSTKMGYSDVIAFANASPGQIEKVTFNPS